VGTAVAKGTPVNILLVDDRPEKLMALESVIHDLGHIVKANSGSEALKALLQEDFAVILLDVNMPHMDGFETASLIRQRRRSEKTPIIFFTALDATDTHVTRGYSLGAVDYIRVPVEPEVLRAKVAAFVDLHNRAERVKQQAEEMRQLQEREHERLMAEAADRLEVETRRNRFFTLAVDMLAIAGYDGHFKQLNPSWRRVLGFTDEQLKAHPLLDLVHEADRDLTAEQWRRLTGGATIAYFENRYRTREGSWRWLGWTAAPFAEEGLVYIFARDITELKAAEEARVVLAREQAARQTAEAAERRAAFLADAGMALAASALDYRATLRQLVHLALPELGDCCVVDVREDDGHIERVEAAHANPERVETARQLLQFAPRAGSPTPQAGVLDTGEALLIPEMTEDVLHTLAAGEEPHAQALAALDIRSLMAVPLVARGRVLGVLTCLVTSSSRRFGRPDLELAQELAHRAALAADNAGLYQSSQEARTAAEQANRAKDEFLATLSHELRTPLTPILGWTVMLRGGRMDPAAMTRGLEVIERNVRAQAQLIEDLLDVSRIITGKLRVDLRPIDVAPVVEAGLEPVRPSAEAKEIRLVCDVQAGGARVLGDPDRLQQVVWNLASNAVKFTPKGGRVQVRLRTLTSHAELSVTDSGRGIGADFLPYVFERFRQADSTSTRKFGGLGLGLAIVRHLVELHGGTVHAESEGLEHGATFTVRLPLLGVEATEAPSGAGGEAAGGEAAGGEAAGAAEPARLAGVRVAVVDDEVDMRDFLTTSLRQYGAEVIALGSAEEAFEALQLRPPDVLVSDIGMPGDDGYTLIRRLRALPAERGGLMPAVALTAFAHGEDGSRVLAAGYQVHIPKPVEPGRLASVLARLVGRSGQAQRPLPVLG
jgi:PAS domain S-box-containing protein